MANKKENEAVNSIETKTKPLTGKAAEKAAAKEAKAAKKAARKAAKEAQKNAAKKEGKEKLGFFAKIAKFFRDYNSEFQKLVWPTRQQLAKNSAVVLVSILVCGLALWGADFVLEEIIHGLYDLVGYIL